MPTSSAGRRPLTLPYELIPGFIDTEDELVGFHIGSLPHLGEIILQKEIELDKFYETTINFGTCKFNLNQFYQEVFAILPNTGEVPPKFFISKNFDLSNLKTTVKEKFLYIAQHVISNREGRLEDLCDLALKYNLLLSANMLISILKTAHSATDLPLLKKATGIIARLKEYEPREFMVFESEMFLNFTHPKYCNTILHILYQQPENFKTMHGFFFNSSISNYLKNNVVSSKKDLACLQKLIKGLSKHPQWQNNLYLLIINFMCNRDVYATQTSQFFPVIQKCYKELCSMSEKKFKKNFSSLLGLNPKEFLLLLPYDAKIRDRFCTYVNKKIYEEVGYLTSENIKNFGKQDFKSRVYSNFLPTKGKLIDLHHSSKRRKIEGPIPKSAAKEV